MTTQRAKTAYLFALWNNLVGKIEVKGKAINTVVNIPACFGLYNGLDKLSLY